MKPTALFSVIVALVLALTACGGSDKPDVAGAKPAKPAAAAAAKAPTSAEPAVAPELPSVPGFDVEPRGVIGDVTVTSCDTAKGPVKAAGTAVNSGKFTRDLVVVVNWADPSTSGVIARGVVTMKDVAPGATVDWTAAADVESAGSVSCVTTGLAGQLT